MRQAGCRESVDGEMRRPPKFKSKEVDDGLSTIFEAKMSKIKDND